MHFIAWYEQALRAGTQPRLREWLIRDLTRPAQRPGTRAQVKYVRMSAYASTIEMSEMASELDAMADVELAGFVERLIRAGVAGGKTVPATVAENPLVFATVTAPSRERQRDRTAPRRRTERSS